MTILTTAEYEAILRADLMSFIERSFAVVNPQKTYLHSKHIEVIASKLEQCRRGEIRRLIINLPPRSLKSHCVSIAFPAWLLGHDPGLEIICASYGQELAEKFARDTRTLMGSSLYKRLFRTRLSDRQAVHDFATTAFGTRLATSVGGVITGRGGDFIILDDPLKPDEALSETRRKAVNEWYDGTLMARLNSKSDGVIIIVMQRLHQEDLVGHVLEQENWHVVTFPAIAEEDEHHEVQSIFGKSHYMRHKGEPLHAARESLEALARIRKDLGEYNFVSQYQQSPTPPGGAMIKLAWLAYYDAKPPHFDTIIQSWDTANKATDLADYSVCTTWGVHDRKFYLLDVFRQRLNYPDLKRALWRLYEEYRPNTVLIEDKASGSQLIQDLQVEHLYAVTPYAPPTGTDKIMRLHAQTANFENGRVLLPRSASWLQEYIAEITGFPGTKFYDQVDSTTQALDHLREPTGAEVWARFGRNAHLLWGLKLPR